MQDDGEFITIACSTLPTVASDTPVADWPYLKERWSHLTDLPVTVTGGRIDILIKTDLWHFVVALESRVGGDYEPAADGIDLDGSFGVVQDEAMVTTVRAHTATGSIQLTKLTQEIRSFLGAGNYGTEYELADMSTEYDRQANSILDDKTRKLDVGYEFPTNW